MPGKRWVSTAEKVDEIPEGAIAAQGGGVSQGQAGRLIERSKALVQQYKQKGILAMLPNGMISEKSVREVIRKQMIEDGKLEPSTDAKLFKLFAEKDAHGAPIYLPHELVIKLAEEGSPLSSTVVYAAFKRFCQMMKDPEVQKRMDERLQAKAREARTLPEEKIDGR